MAAFLLIHGGRHGSWCWDPVGALLEARSHRVAAPDLPGRDGRPTSIEKTYQAATCALEALGPAIVLAHSIGGATAVLLASRRRDLVQGVVFAAAAVPAPGRPLVVDAYGRALGVLMLAVGNREGPIAHVAARWFFGHRLSSSQRRWLLERLVRERNELLTKRPFPEYSLAGVPCRYVLTERDRLLPPRVQARYAGRLPGAEVISVDGGHSIFAEHPQTLAEVVETFAAELLSTL